MDGETAVMAEWLIGILASLGTVLAALLRGALKRNETLKEERKDAEDQLYLVRSQMETVRQCREDLGLIEKKAEEEKPVKKDPPASGDSSSRLERLNRLHEHTGNRQY